MNPESVGKKMELVVGKHSGRHAIVNVLEALDYSFDEDELTVIVERIKELADKQKTVLMEDVAVIADGVLSKSHGRMPYLVLDDVKVSCASRMKSAAEVKVTLRGDSKSAKSVGVGPVDAVANAIKKIVGPRIKLKEYELKAIGGGTSALADVLLTVADEDQREYCARGVDEDIVMASAKAIVNGINVIERERG